jgi:hypothetical protein
LWAWAGVTAAIDVALGVVVWRHIGYGYQYDHGIGIGIGRIGRELALYGGPRMIGAVAQLSTVALAPTIALWSGAAAGEAAALSVAAMFGVLLGPVRLALQPVALTRLAEERGAPSREARELAQKFVAAAACATGAFGGALVTSGDRLAALWLGERFAAPALVLASVAAVALQFFCYALEGVLDADDGGHRRPRAQLAAAALFAVGALAAVEARAGAAGVVVAQLAASLAQTALYLALVARRYGLPTVRELLNGAVTVGGAAVLVGAAARWTGEGALATALAVAAQGVVALATALAARASGARWPELLLPRRRAA